MSTYPDYVHQMLARARDGGQWHAAQSDAAGICFDVLALFPDCEEAKERTAPYRRSIDPQLASLFTASNPLENEKSLPTLVDWSFLDKDDGQAGEPAEWVKKQRAAFLTRAIFSARMQNNMLTDVTRRPTGLF